MSAKKKTTPLPPLVEGDVAANNTTTGEKFRAVRWSINQAALEFSIDKGMLSKRLKALSIEPGTDARFSTMQICAAKYGDLDMERTRKVREDADGSALANAQKRRQLGEVRLFILFCAEIGMAIKQHLMASELTDKEKDDMCEELASFFDKGEVTRRVCPDV